VVVEKLACTARVCLRAGLRIKCRRDADNRLVTHKETVLMARLRRKISMLGVWRNRRLGLSYGKASLVSVQVYPLPPILGEHPVINGLAIAVTHGQARSVATPTTRKSNERKRSTRSLRNKGLVSTRPGQVDRPNFMFHLHRCCETEIGLWPSRNSPGPAYSCNILAARVVDLRARLIQPTNAEILI